MRLKAGDLALAYVDDDHIFLVRVVSCYLKMSGAFMVVRALGTKNRFILTLDQLRSVRVTFS